MLQDLLLTNKQSEQIIKPDPTIILACLTGPNGIIYRSVDGNVFTLLSTPSLGNYSYDLFFVNNLFFVVSNNGKILVSSDGVTWTLVTITGINSKPLNIYFDGTKFILITDSSNSNACICTSLNGYIWTVITPTNLLNNSRLWYIYKNNIHIVGYQFGVIGTSIDGINWQNLSLPITNETVRCIEYDGTVFYGIYDSGIVITSIDGINWNSIGIQSFGAPIGNYLFKYLNNRFFVSAGNNNKLFYSEPGIFGGWKFITLPGSGYPKDITLFKNTYFIAAYQYTYKTMDLINIFTSTLPMNSYGYHNGVETN